MLANLFSDVRYCLRGFRLRPGFAVVIVLTLAFGIGVNVAVFSMYDGLLLRPLPVHEPGRLVNFGGPGPKPGGTSCNEAGNCDDVFSYPMFRDLERADGPFAGLAAQRPMQANLGFEGQTATRAACSCPGSYFPRARTRAGARPSARTPTTIASTARRARSCWATTTGSTTSARTRPPSVTRSS